MTNQRTAKPTFSAIDWIADRLHGDHCRTLAIHGPRWWALRVEEREKWRARARANVKTWGNAERVLLKKYSTRGKGA